MGQTLPPFFPPGKGSSSASALKLPVLGRRLKESLIKVSREGLQWAAGWGAGSAARIRPCVCFGSFLLPASSPGVSGGGRWLSLQPPPRIPPLVNPQG